MHENTVLYAENFWARELSQISWFESHLRKFSPRNLGVPYPPMLGFSIPRNDCSHRSAKVFSLKSFLLYSSTLAWTLRTHAFGKPFYFPSMWGMMSNIACHTYFTVYPGSPSLCHITLGSASCNTMNSMFVTLVSACKGHVIVARSGWSDEVHYT